MFWRLLKTLLFTLVMPGTFGVYLPQVLKSGSLGLSLPVRLVGLAISGCGGVIYLWCAWDFATKGLGTPLPLDAPRLLVVKGLYRFTRNPMYVGVLSLIFGQAIYYGSSSVGIYGGLVLLVFHLFVRVYEEPTLRRQFGSQYEEYCGKVPRWILHLRRA